MIIYVSFVSKQLRKCTTPIPQFLYAKLIAGSQKETVSDIVIHAIMQSYTLNIHPLYLLLWYRQCIGKL